MYRPKPFSDAIDNPLTGPPRRPKRLPREEKYNDIAQTLLICEAGHWKVGIPWLPPTRRTWALRKKFDGSLGEFLKMSLCTVSTQTLESYCDDLESLADEPRSAEKLGIVLLSPLERRGMTFLLCFFCLAIPFLALLNAGSPFPLAVGSSILTSLFGFTAGRITSSDAFRRTSFLYVLRQELDRRNGIEGGRLRAIPIAAKPNTAS